MAIAKSTTNGHTNLGSNPNDTQPRWSVPTNPVAPNQGNAGPPAERGNPSNIGKTKGINKRSAIGKGGRGGSPRDMIAKAAQRRLMSS